MPWHCGGTGGARWWEPCRTLNRPVLEAGVRETEAAAASSVPFAPPTANVAMGKNSLITQDMLQQFQDIEPDLHREMRSCVVFTDYSIFKATKKMLMHD